MLGDICVRLLFCHISPFSVFSFQGTLPLCGVKCFLELARNAICPSHYMAASEMYRATGDKRYLELAEGLIAIREHVYG